MKNVHEFDRKLNIQTKGDPINEEIWKEFLQRPGIASTAKEMAIDIIENSPKNKDEINRADAKVLFFELLTKIKTLSEEDQKDMYFLLEEQLTDMLKLGPCAQGRTIRLWQLLQCF